MAAPMRRIPAARSGVSVVSTVIAESAGAREAIPAGVSRTHVGAGAGVAAARTAGPSTPRTAGRSTLLTAGRSARRTAGGSDR